MRDFRRLEVWQDAIDLVQKVYLISKELPISEKYGLIAQMKRCAVSIPSNIAEGSSRRTLPDYRRFIEIAIGSAFELETQLVICKQLGFISQGDVHIILNELTILQKRLAAFQKSLC